MNNYFEAPEIFQQDDQRKSIFLAGGISGQPHWQKDIAEKLLKRSNLIVLNPRREEFPIDDPSETRRQIAWEFEHLKKADVILFWFPPATLCPIALFELGRWLKSDKVLFIGMDPAYRRRRDIEIQVELARPDLQVFYSLRSLVEVILAWKEKAGW